MSPEASESLTPHLTFQRRSSQPITQNSTGKTQNSKKQNTAKQSYRGSVASYNTLPGNNMGIFYNTSEPTEGEGLAHLGQVMIFISK